MLLQFITGAFFKWMSNIVFEPSSAEKTMGRESLCDPFSFEYGHGWVLGLSSRQLKPWYKLCYVRAKGLMCFISCEGVTLCLCALAGLSVIYLSHVEWRGFVKSSQPHGYPAPFSPVRELFWDLGFWRPHINCWHLLRWIFDPGLSRKRAQLLNLTHNIEARCTSLVAHTQIAKFDKC